MVSERHQGGEEVHDYRGIDEVHLFPYRVGDSIRAGGGSGGAFGEGETDFFLGEGRGGGVPCKAASAGEGVLRGKEVVEERVVDSDRVGGIRERGEPGGLSWGDQLLGRPDVVRGGFCEEISPVGSFGPLNGFEVAEPGLSCCGVGVGGPEFFSPAGGFCEFLL